MKTIKTRLTDLLGIQYPIIQGGMAAGKVSTAELVSAVSNAGGLGLMSALQWIEDFDELEDQIKRVKDSTDKPWGVNLSLFTQDMAVWDPILEMIDNYKVPVVETSGRNPAMLIEKINNAGAIWMHKVARVRDGIKAASLGAKAVVIIGSEEGGHPGRERSATSVVGPLMVDSVDIPVAIGGGFCDGRGLLSALAMGGEAVYMGTRFCASEECVIHPDVKKSILEMAYNETDYILMSHGDPVRALRNEYTGKILELESQHNLEALNQLLAESMGNIGKKEYAINTGDINGGVIPIGMVGGRITEILPVKEIIENIMSEAIAGIERLQTQAS